MSENQPENNDGLSENVEDAISGADGAVDGAANSAKDAAAGAADAAKDMLGSAKDKLPGGDKGAAAAAGAAGLAGSLKGKAADLVGSGADGASSLKDKAAAAAEKLGGKVSDVGAPDVDVPDVDVPDLDAPDVSSKGSSLKERAAAAKANMADAANSMKDKAADAAGSAKDAASGATDGVKGAAAGATAGAAGLAGSMKDKAADAAGSAKDAAAGAADGVTGGVKGAADSAKGAVAGAADSAKGAGSGVTGGVKGAAAAATAGAAGVAATASDKVGAVASSVSETAKDAASSVTGDSVEVSQGGGGAGGGSSSGGSGSGSGGGGGRNDDDDEMGFFQGTPISGEWQIIGLGLLVAALFLFGSSIWGWITGDDASLGDTVESIADGPQCEAAWDELRSSDLDEDTYSDLTCAVQNGKAVLSGEVDSLSQRTAVAAALAGLAGTELTLPDVDEPEVEEVEEVAAEVTTTTAAPTTTTTTAAPETTTTTEAPETTTTTEAPPELTTMWQAMNDSGQASQFAIIGGALGLQDSLEGTEPAQRTLFAPSDAALQKLDPATINAIASDPARANALVGYHILPGALLAADVAALDGTSVQTLTGLPMDITVVDGEVFINGDTKVVGTDFTADNGVVHIIDTVLTPPSANASIGLENIEFEVNSDVITAAGQAELEKAVAFFNERETANALIEGHTDTDGADADNLDLSQRRADAVKAYLVGKGIAADRLTTEGFGETQPILVDGAEDKAQSRRIEFQLR